MNFAHISFMSLVMSLIPYRPIIWLAIVILHYIQVYYPFYILEHSPQYSSHTECMDFIQILCFTPKAHRNLFFFQELLSHFCCWIHNACYMVESYVKVHMRSHVQYMVHLYSSIKTLLVIFGFSSII